MTPMRLGISTIPTSFRDVVQMIPRLGITPIITSLSNIDFYLIND